MALARDRLLNLSMELGFALMKEEVNVFELRRLQREMIAEAERNAATRKAIADLADYSEVKPSTDRWLRAIGKAPSDEALGAG